MFLRLVGRLVGLVTGIGIRPELSRWFLEFFRTIAEQSFQSACMASARDILEKAGNRLLPHGVAAAG